MVEKKKKRNVSFSDLRERLEEYAGMRDRQEGWYEAKETEVKSNLFAYYPFSALWQMHRFLLIKTALIMLVIIFVFILTFINIPFTATILQNINYITTWETDFISVGREVLPAVQYLWTGSMDDGLESPVIAPPPSLPVEHRDGETMEFNLPLEGEPVRNFGIYEDVAGEQKMSYGLLLAAPGAKPVYAAAAGVVKEVREVYGGGFQMVLVHNNGLETCYGYLQEVIVDEQGMVKQGEVIGSTGIEEAEGRIVLYFEIRENGRPVDPLPLLEKAAGSR